MAVGGSISLRMTLLQEGLRMVPSTPFACRLLRLPLRFSLSLSLSLSPLSKLLLVRQMRLKFGWIENNL